MRIFELRKNPESNPKINPGEYIAKLANSEGGNNTWVSFTELDKLGINPKSKWNTPIGVYAYPAWYVARKTENGKHDMTTVPFAGDMPYVNIFSLSGNVVSLDTMSDSDMNSYLDKISNYIIRHKWITQPPPVYKSMPILNYDMYIKSIITKFRSIVDSVRSDSEYDVDTYIKTPGGKFWYTVNLIARRIFDDTKKSKNSVIWNKLFRIAGIDAVYSNTGIIHPNEPVQCVVFNPTIIKVINRLPNIDPTKVKSSGYGNLIKQLKQENGPRKQLALYNKAEFHDEQDRIDFIVDESPEILQNVDQNTRTNVLQQHYTLFKMLKSPTVEDMKTAFDIMRNAYATSDITKYSWLSKIWMDRFSKMKHSDQKILKQYRIENVIES